MYKLVKYTDDLDLSEFYKTCSERGLVNNSSRKNMIDCFNNEREFNCWILYYNDIIVGSVASHSFDIMGVNSYRIAARTCVLSHLLQIGRAHV